MIVFDIGIEIGEICYKTTKIEFVSQEMVDLLNERKSRKIVCYFFKFDSSWKGKKIAKMFFTFELTWIGKIG